MGGAVFPHCSLAWSQTIGGVMAVMLTSFKTTYASTLDIWCPWQHNQPTVDTMWTQCPEIPGHWQARLVQSLVGSPLLSPDPGAHKVLFVLFKSVSPVLWKFCNQIPLAFKVKLSGGSHCFCQNPGWEICCALELLQQCENFFGTIVLQFVGCLLSGSIVELMATSSKRISVTHCASQFCCSCSPQVTADLGLHRRHSHTQRQVWLCLLWRSLLNFLGPGAHKVLLAPSKCLWWVWNVILHEIVPSYHLADASPFPLDVGYPFWWDPTFSC